MPLTGRACRDQAGEDVPHAHGDSAARDTRAAGQGVQVVECTQGPRQSGDKPPNLLVQASHAGAGSKAQEDARDTGQYDRGGKSTVDHRRADVVELHKVGSSAVQAGVRRPYTASLALSAFLDCR